MLLTQRMPGPAVRHQNTPQIVVATEPDTEHVKHFTFVPARGRPDAGNTGSFGIFTVQCHLDPQVAWLGKIKQVVNQSEMLLRSTLSVTLIDSCQVFQPLITHGTFMLEKVK